MGSYGVTTAVRLTLSVFLCPEHISETLPQWGGGEDFCHIGNTHPLEGADVPFGVYFLSPTF